MIEIDIEQRRLNQIIQESLGLARGCVEQGDDAGMICHALVISAVEISREAGADPFDVLNNALNSAIYAIRKNVEIIESEQLVLELIETDIIH